MIRRVKRRYLVVQIDSSESFDEADFRTAVWSAVTELFGEYGASQTGLFFVMYDKRRREAVLRCSHKALPIVRASLASVTKIKEKPTALHVMKISGTLKALAKKTHASSA